MRISFFTLFYFRRYGALWLSGGCTDWSYTCINMWRWTVHAIHGAVRSIPAFTVWFRRSVQSTKGMPTVTYKIALAALFRFIAIIFLSFFLRVESSSTRNRIRFHCCWWRQRRFSNCIKIIGGTTLASLTHRSRFVPFECLINRMTKNSKIVASTSIDYLLNIVCPVFDLNASIFMRFSTTIPFEWIPCLMICINALHILKASTVRLNFKNAKHAFQLPSWMLSYFCQITQMIKWCHCPIDLSLQLKVEFFADPLSRLTQIQMIVSIATAYRAKDYGITINDLQWHFLRVSSPRLDDSR